MALTKHDTVRQVQEIGHSQSKSGEIVESLLEIIKSSLESGEDVLVSNFGKFALNDKAREREGIQQLATTCTWMHAGWCLLNVQEGCGKRLTVETVAQPLTGGDSALKIICIYFR